MQSGLESRSRSHSPLRRYSTGDVRNERTRPVGSSSIRRSADIVPAAMRSPGSPEESSHDTTLPPSLDALARRHHGLARQPGRHSESVPIAPQNIFLAGSSPPIPSLELRPVEAPEPWRIEQRPNVRFQLPGRRAAVQEQRQGVVGRARSVLAFFGYGTNNRYRKELVSLVWTLSFGFVQFSVTIAMIAYSSVHHSPREPSLSEWKACDKPLGLWACFWIAKLMLDCCMTYWGWTRDWKVQQSEQHGGQEGDTEQGLPGLEGISSQEQFDPTTLTSVNNNRRRRQATAPFSRLYSRLSLLLSLIIVSWFLTSNILVFTSLHTCRFAAPHLWWLIFSVLCLQYLIILEVFVIAMLVFIIGPLIYLFWNIVLICLGRHPMQNPHYINPEIGKLSKSLVDQIPLVLYIPSPPEGEKKGAGVSDADIIAKPEPVYTPGGAEHTYPPKPPAPKRRFTFLSRKSSKYLSGIEDATALGLDEKGGGGDTEERIWEDCWEHGEFPFVRLEENRASCAICLLDFEEPKRRVARDVIRSWAQNNKGAAPENDASVGAEGAEKAPSSNTPSSSGPSRRPSDVQEVPATDDSGSEEHSLRLEDAGEGAQPLRLLECGHVFHKTCVDPWLTDVSGRCPTCQRPVTLPVVQKKKRDRTRS